MLCQTAEQVNHLPIGCGDHRARSAAFRSGLGCDAGLLVPVGGSECLGRCHVGAYKE